MPLVTLAPPTLMPSSFVEFFPADSPSDFRQMRP
jgi:hypothetical protein